VAASDVEDPADLAAILAQAPEYCASISEKPLRTSKIAVRVGNDLRWKRRIFEQFGAFQAIHYFFPSA
jgi:hypothetical protein